MVGGGCFEGAEYRRLLCGCFWERRRGCGVEILFLC